MKKLWFLLPAIILALVILRPILIGNVWYPMHDTTHVARLYLMSETLHRGEFPPLWAADINHGLGYPLFHFYAPFFYYVAYLFSLPFGYFIGLKLTLLFFIVLGIIGVMRLVAPRGKLVTLLVAVLFATSPYLAVNLYVRGAYAELAALCLFPITLSFWANLTNRRSQLIAGLTMAMFVASHNLLPMLAFPFIAFYLLWKYRHEPVKLFLPSIITLLVSAFYLLPIFFERHFVQADTIARTSNYQLHYVIPWQLWNSTWGFGGSAFGVEDGFSFKLGKLQLIVAFLGFVVAFFKRSNCVFWGIGALYFLFMATPYSSFIWDHFSLLSLAQFPWRHLGLALSLLAVVGASFTTQLRPRFIRYIVSLILISGSLILNLKYFVPAHIFPAKISDFTSNEYLSNLVSIIPEYMPASLDSSYIPNSFLNNTGFGQTIIARAYYPTWRVKLDGQYVSTFPSETGPLTINNPTGSSAIVLTQAHTPIEIVGYSLTILGLSLFIYLWFKR